MTPQLFRRRPILVEATRINAADWETTEEIATWCNGSLLDLDYFLQHNDKALMYVPDGDAGAEGAYAEDGDWIVRLHNSRFAVIDDRVFNAEFHAVVAL